VLVIGFVYAIFFGYLIFEVAGREGVHEKG
jgi:hypothetical protein